MREIRRNGKAYEILSGIAGGLLRVVIPSRSGPGLSNEDRHRKADPRLGRPGMEQWKILVLGVLRLGLNSDYDRIHDGLARTQGPRLLKKIGCSEHRRLNEKEVSNG